MRCQVPLLRYQIIYNILSSSLLRMASRKVLTCRFPQTYAQCRLICFPWAGGGALFYANWGKLFSSNIEGMYAKKFQGIFLHFWEGALGPFGLGIALGILLVFNAILGKCHLKMLRVSRITCSHIILYHLTLN